MDLTIFILTHVCQDCQYEPQVYLTRKEAEQALKEKYEELDDATFKQWSDIGTDWAKIIYQDDTFDELEIYTINIHDDRRK